MAELNQTEPTAMELLLARINTEAQETGVPVYCVVTGTGRNPETFSIAELPDEWIAEMTGIEIHIQLP